MTNEGATDGRDGPIVIAYDGSGPSQAAVDWAAAEAGRSRRPLTVLHVIDAGSRIPHPIALRPWADHDSPGGQVARQGADRARRTAEVEDVQAWTRTGPVAATLIDVSRQAELIVLGTRGHGDLAAAVLGSVVFTVTAHAHCPVVVVRGDSTQAPGPECPVVVGADGSSGSWTAVRYAADTAARAAAPLVVVTAYRPEPPRGDPGSTDCDFAPAAAAPPGLPADDRQAAAMISSAALDLARQFHPQIDVRAQVLLGTAWGQLCTSAHRAGLLVVGTRGRGRLTGLLLGSVGHAVIRSAPCPVAVVPTAAGVTEPTPDHHPPV